MKKILILSIIAFLLLITFPSLYGCTEYKGDFLFSGNEITGLTEIGKSKETLVIPTKINGIEINRIASGAFLGSDHLKKITVPNTIQFLGDSILSNCNNIEHVIVPFLTKTSSNTQFLASLFGGDSYSDCSCIPQSLKNVEITGETNISDNCFYGCSNLENIIFSEKISSFGKNAFKWCHNLTTINIPLQLIVIGQDAFYGCNSLKKVYVDSIEHWISIRYINKLSNPLYFCEALYVNNIELSGEIEITSGTKISDYSFYNYKKITTLTLSNTITNIGQSAFEYCTNIQQIKLSHNLEEIGKYAFSDCTGIQQITIPESVYLIDGQAFARCTNLETAEFADINNWRVYSISNNPIDVSDSSTAASELVNNCFFGWFKGIVMG